VSTGLSDDLLRTGLLVGPSWRGEVQAGTRVKDVARRRLSGHIAGKHIASRSPKLSVILATSLHACILGRENPRGYLMYKQT
jgi:hypothetical protein